MLHAGRAAARTGTTTSGSILSRPYRLDQLEREALRVPGVVDAETLGLRQCRAPAARRRAPRATTCILMRLQPGRELLVPVISAGALAGAGGRERHGRQHRRAARTSRTSKVGERDRRSRSRPRRPTGASSASCAGWLRPVRLCQLPRTSRAWSGDVGRASSVHGRRREHDRGLQARSARRWKRHFKDIGVRVSFDHQDRRGAQAMQAQRSTSSS